MVNARQARTAREKAAEMRAEAARKAARGRAIAIVSAVIAVIVVAVGAGIIIQMAKHNQDVKTAAAVAPPANLTNNGYLVGSPNAKVTIEVWEDFQCPACENFESLNGAQLKKWAADGTVKTEYHPVAILDRYSSTNYSTRSLNAFAAVINAKAAAVDKFHSLLFANQPAENTPGLPDSQLIEYAVQAGVDRASVENAITTLKYKGWTQTVTNEFSEKGYTATPTILVNGKKVDDYAPDKIEALVEAAKKG
jgi:protein-disulfide isomerase